MHLPLRLATELAKQQMLSIFLPYVMLNLLSEEMYFVVQLSIYFADRGASMGCELVTRVL